MGAPKAREIRRQGEHWQAMTPWGDWRDVSLWSLQNSELRRAAMIVFPDVKGNLWMSVSKRETLAAVESGILPQSIGTTVHNGPDNSAALCAAQDEIARLRDALAAAASGPDPSIPVPVPPPSERVRHQSFDQVFALCALGLNVYLVGPAGTGKTTLAAQVAEALGRPFGTLSCHAQMTGTALFGYMDAQGRYVSTDYRRMTTGDGSDNGAGVFLMDEIDNGNPNIIAAMNAGLANGHISFPDGLRNVHEDHVFIASANTYGTGPTAQYVGRTALDAATKDRFVTVEVDYDRTLEMTLASRYGTKGAEWCKRIHAYRDAAQEANLKVILSTRAIIDGAKMLAAGMSISTVESQRVFAGWQGDQVSKVRAGYRAAKRETPAETPAETPERETQWRRITSDYAGNCSVCGKGYDVGDRVDYNPLGVRGRKVRHISCGTV